jgi:hypothetical protein
MRRLRTSRRITGLPAQDGWAGHRNYRNTRIAGDPRAGVWFTDGKAVTYPGMVDV